MGEDYKCWVAWFVGTRFQDHKGFITKEERDAFIQGYLIGSSDPLNDKYPTSFYRSPELDNVPLEGLQQMYGQELGEAMWAYRSGSTYEPA